MISQENKNRDISDIQKQERTNGNQEQQQKRGDMPEKKERREDTPIYEEAEQERNIETDEGRTNPTKEVELPDPHRKEKEIIDENSQDTQKKSYEKSDEKSNEQNQVQSKGQTGKDDPNWQQKKINEAYNEKKNTLDIEDEEDIEKGREKKKPGKETDASELDKPPLETYEEERQTERRIAHESSERKPERHIPL